jgi:hypothetical protein
MLQKIVLAFVSGSAAALIAPPVAKRSATRLYSEKRSWAAENPATLAFVCGGLFGLAPYAGELSAATPADFLRAATNGSGRWPFLGFAPVVGFAASGALKDPTFRTLAASLASFGIANQFAARVAEGVMR